MASTLVARAAVRAEPIFQGEYYELEVQEEFDQLGWINSGTFGAQSLPQHCKRLRGPSVFFAKNKQTIKIFDLYNFVNSILLNEYILYDFDHGELERRRNNRQHYSIFWT